MQPVRGIRPSSLTGLFVGDGAELELLPCFIVFTLCKAQVRGSRLTITRTGKTRALIVRVGWDVSKLAGEQPVVLV